VPRPVAQVDVLDPGGRFIGRADLLWPELRVVGEADGREKFRGMPGADTSERAVAERLVAAAERARSLEALGLAVVRWGAGDLTHPAALAARILGARPVGELRAVLLCSRCREEVAGCRCAPALFLCPRRAAA
jgi:hypothetical protein